MVQAREHDTTHDAVKELVARERIRELIYRYCRATDRHDEAELRSCYWPDATDEHGDFNGPVSNFLTWAVEALKSPRNEREIHMVHNIILDFRDGGCMGESYWTAFAIRPATEDPDGPTRRLSQMGRYIDWFEERNGEWRIKHRTTVFDWFEELPAFPTTEEERFGHRRPIGGRRPNDPLYQISYGVQA